MNLNVEIPLRGYKEPKLSDSVLAVLATIAKNPGIGRKGIDSKAETTLGVIGGALNILKMRGSIRAKIVDPRLRNLAYYATEKGLKELSENNSKGIEE